MRGAPIQQDLVVLVADADMECAVSAMLGRPIALGIRQIRYRIFRHDLHDPGCRSQGHVYLRAFAYQYRHALVLFDREGCGKEQCSADELEKEVGESLGQNGWDDRAAAIVIDPELESWFWGSSGHVPACLGWKSLDELKDWLETRNLWRAGEPKPWRPKEAVEQALEKARTPRSPSIYARLATHSSLRHCTDRKFRRFTEILRRWFPREDTGG